MNQQILTHSVKRGADRLRSRQSSASPNATLPANERNRRRLLGVGSLVAVAAVALAPVSLYAPYLTSSGSLIEYDSGGAMVWGGSLYEGSTTPTLSLGTTGVRAFWYPRKAAFRFGSTSTASYWSDAAIGLYSFGAGNSARAGDYSFVFGSSAFADYYSVALGNNASAEGWSFAAGSSAYAESGSVALGDGALASYGAIAIGYEASANTFGVALGSGSTADSGGFAVGEGGYATGDGAAAIGLNVTAHAYSAAFGSGTWASGNYAFTSGLGTLASASYASAHGQGTTAEQPHLFAIGKYNVTPASPALFVVGKGTSSSARSNALEVLADGTSRFFGGIQINGTTVINEQGEWTGPGGVGGSAVTQEQIDSWDAVADMFSGNSFVGGGASEYTTGFAFGPESYAETNAFAVGKRVGAGAGDGAFAAGADSFAVGPGTVALGTGTYASGEYSFTSGFGTNASGDYASAHGQGTLAAQNHLFAIGKYNATPTAPALFVVGKGTSSTARSNAFEVLADGTSRASGSLIVGASGSGTIQINGQTVIDSARNWVGPTLSTSKVPNLSASKITSGVLSYDRLPISATQVAAWDAFVANGGGGGAFSLNGSSAYYNGGNVGIGTNNPGFKLDVAGTIQATSNVIVKPTSSQFGKAYINASDVEGAEITLQSAGSLSHPSYNTVSRRRFWIIDNCWGSFRVFSGGATEASGTPVLPAIDIKEDPQNAAQAVIKLHGNVGIETISPAEKLHVAGPLRVSGAISSGDGTYANITTVSNSLRVDGTDLRLGTVASGRGDGGRALVQDDGDTLAINYGEDFEGGVRIRGDVRVDSLTVMANFSVEPVGDIPTGAFQ